jgi:hypothetical protein
MKDFLGALKEIWTDRPMMIAWQAALYIFALAGAISVLIDIITYASFDQIEEVSADLCPSGTDSVNFGLLRKILHTKGKPFYLQINYNLHCVTENAPSSAQLHRTDSDIVISFDRFSIFRQAETKNVISIKYLSLISSAIEIVLAQRSDDVYTNLIYAPGFLMGQGAYVLRRVAGGGAPAVGLPKWRLRLVPAPYSYDLVKQITCAEKDWSTIRKWLQCPLL